MSTATIRAALENALGDWSDAEDVPVAWGNVGHTPEPPYARAFFMPGKPAVMKSFTSSGVSYTGIFQVTLVLERGKGSKAAEDIETSLRTHFPINAPLEQGGIKVNIIEPMCLGPEIPGSKHYEVPVSCAYSAHIFA